MFLTDKTVITMAKQICGDSDRIWIKDSLAAEITSQLMEQNRFFLTAFISNLINPKHAYESLVLDMVDDKLQKIKLRDHNFIRRKLKKDEASLV